MIVPLYKSCLSALAVMVGLSITSAQAASHQTPIRFDKGQITSTVTGKLSPQQDERWYHFTATKGQYALINIAPLFGTVETANTGVLHMPDGSRDGTKGGIIYQGCLPESGKYRLRIARNLMATHGKTAGYRVEVVILPPYASQALCQ